MQLHALPFRVTGWALFQIFIIAGLLLRRKGSFSAEERVLQSFCPETGELLVHLRYVTAEKKEGSHRFLWVSLTASQSRLSTPI